MFESLHGGRNCYDAASLRNSPGPYQRTHFGAVFSRGRPPRCSAYRQVTAASGSEPHRMLGVQPGATHDAIKRAYRKLVLRVHPDLNKDGGSDEQFIQVHQAYETLIKNRGQPKPVGPPGQDTWNFHDWHWKFRMERAWQHQHHKPGAVNPHASTERLQPLHRSQVHEQLATLKRKARYRATKVAASPLANMAAVECSPPDPAAEPLRTHLHHRPAGSTHMYHHGASSMQQPLSAAPRADGDSAASTAATARGCDPATAATVEAAAAAASSTPQPQVQASCTAEASRCRAESATTAGGADAHGAGAQQTHVTAGWDDESISRPQPKSSQALPQDASSPADTLRSDSAAAGSPQREGTCTRQQHQPADSSTRGESSWQESSQDDASSGGRHQQRTPAAFRHNAGHTGDGPAHQSDAQASQGSTALLTKERREDESGSSSGSEAEGSDDSAQDQELRFKSSERIRAQLAGLRRKRRLA